MLAFCSTLVALWTTTAMVWSKPLAYPLGFEGPMPLTSAVVEARKWQASNRQLLTDLGRVLPLIDACSETTSGKQKQRRPQPVRYVHFPKCATTFFTSIFRYACSERDDVYVGASTPADLRGGLITNRSVIDVAALGRYASLEACPLNHSFAIQQHLAKHLASWSTHEPLRGTSKSAVALFRSPNQRLLSAFNFGSHLWGSEMRGPEIGGRYFQRWRDLVTRKANSSRTYATTPGVNGCFTKMLMGCYCATRVRPLLGTTTLRYDKPLEVACPYAWRSLDRAFVDAAVDKVKDFAFVGLQDFYNVSVCLFQRKFPHVLHAAEFASFNLSPKRRRRRSKNGLLNGKGDPPAAALGGEEGGQGPEKHRISTTMTAVPWEEAALGDFVDIYDERVYAAAMDRFLADLQSEDFGEKGNGLLRGVSRRPEKDKL